MYVTCMLHVWANMAQSLCTRAFEPHHVIWLYVFAKYVSVLQISDALFKQYEHQIFYSASHIFNFVVSIFFSNALRFAAPSYCLAYKRFYNYCCKDMKNPLKNKIFFSRIWLFGYFSFGYLAVDTSLPASALNLFFAYAQNSSVFSTLQGGVWL